jgi:hypothetical protein
MLKTSRTPPQSQYIYLTCFRGTLSGMFVLHVTVIALYMMSDSDHKRHTAAAWHIYIIMQGELDLLHPQVCVF